MAKKMLISNISIKPNILLWGGDSQSRIIEEMIRENNLGDVKIIFDSTLNALSFKTNAHFVNDTHILKNNIHSISHFVTCIGGEHGYARFKTSEYLVKFGLVPISLIHKKSFVEPTSSIGKGCQIMPNAIIHKFSEIGNYVILNTNSTIDHECLIGNGVHIMGNAAIAGKVQIGDYATVGTNSTVLPYIKVGEGAFIGAGSVVTKDVEPYSVIAGNPAKFMRKNVFTFYEKPLLELIN